jgi:hypothetical protein
VVNLATLRRLETSTGNLPAWLSLPHSSDDVSDEGDDCSRTGHKDVAERDIEVLEGEVAIVPEY